MIPWWAALVIGFGSTLAGMGVLVLLAYWYLRRFRL